MQSCASVCKDAPNVREYVDKKEEQQGMCDTK
jgi:hypothetical protein